MQIDFDPFSPEIRSDPYSRYRELRNDAPVYYAPAAKVWCVSRYDDVLGVLNNPETYSSEAMFTELMNGGSDGPPKLTWRAVRFIAAMLWKARLHPGKFQNARTLLSEDGEPHAETRRIVNRGFTPRRIAQLEPRVRAMADECLVGLRRGEPFDLVRELAIPLPVAIISDMLGIEPERRADFKRWSDTIIETASTLGGRARRQRLEANVTEPYLEMFSFLRQLAVDRRKAPSDDLISTIVARQAGEDGLTDYDVVAFVLVLLVAGNETTTNLIGNAVSALLDAPGELEKLQADPELVAPAIEEVLRFDAPIQLVFRTARRDVELHGTKIRKGECVVPLIGSANRDERRFEDPDVFDIERRTQGHLGFGFGEHFCLGASLARLEARCALEALLPDLAMCVRASAERQWVDSFLVRGPSRLLLDRAA